MDTYKHPYEYNPEYSQRTAYFCMEYGIDQAFKIYSGGLGYLAGSHMRSALDLKQNLIGIGILWKYGYYDQRRSHDQRMDVLFQEKSYTFLQETNIKFQIDVNGHPVWVKALYLSPDVFGTAPMYFLSTDLQENDHLARTISNRLYDNDAKAKIAQYILLGVGGAKLLEKINYEPDTYHINEAHALPLSFYLYSKWGRDAGRLKDHFVLTTHTPVPAGNESHNIHFLHRMGFFNDLQLEEARELTGIREESFNLTLGALRLARLANGVSRMHGEVARKMWSPYDNICEITHITNSQNEKYWTDPQLKLAFENRDFPALIERKRKLKRKLFQIVADQTGKLFGENVLTIVWARRFAGYKRAEMLTWDMEQFREIFNNEDRPVQMIWAGKPYPMDEGAKGIFNLLVDTTRRFKHCTVLVGYELALSKALKQGSDVWLNTPRVTREASGTSGMTAAMNGSLNLSTWDGWIPEFARDNENAFIIPEPVDPGAEAVQDEIDRNNLYEILRDRVIPTFYDNQEKWKDMVFTSMEDIVPYFDSNRMASEYYTKLYNHQNEAVPLGIHSGNR